MKSKNAARLIGVFFLVAMAASLGGAGIIETVISEPNYLNTVSAQSTALFSGLGLELINAIAVVGIAYMMFPILKQYSTKMAAGYLAFRIIESVSCIAAAVVPLSLLVLSRDFIEVGGAMDGTRHETLGSLIKSARADISAILIPLFFCLGALIFYYFLYRTKRLPRYISIWGFIGILLIFILIFLNVEMGIAMFFALPIILNEILMGVLLLVKGFNTGKALRD